MNNRRLIFVAYALLVLGATSSAADDAKIAESKKPKFRTESVRGKVVWFGEALKDHFKISTVPESYERTLAIHTEQGHLLPLAEDLRGRSFRTDERLRDKPMELFVRRYEMHPMLQIIRVYEFKEQKKYQVDYWCDVCAIVMFEKGFCACCQDNNRLRHRLVDKQPTRRAVFQPAVKETGSDR
jgi:hypothetical protein